MCILRVCARCLLSARPGGWGHHTAEYICLSAYTIKVTLLNWCLDACLLYDEFTIGRGPPSCRVHAFLQQSILNFPPAYVYVSPNTERTIQNLEAHFWLRMYNCSVLRSTCDEPLRMLRFITLHYLLRSRGTQIYFDWFRSILSLYSVLLGPSYRKKNGRTRIRRFENDSSSPPACSVPPSVVELLCFSLCGYERKTYRARHFVV